ncbi:hypothetical protein [Vibrio sp.]
MGSKKQEAKLDPITLTDYFKLKIRQTSILETHSTTYPEIKLI